MSLNSIFDISGSAMNAQSVRLNTTASNIANAQTASSSSGEVYRGRHPVFRTVFHGVNQGHFQNHASQASVRVAGIVESQAELQRRYEPHHPEADEQGYVFYPNVNVVEEMTDMISASRSFQVNVEVMNSAKQMMQRVLTLGQ